MANGKKYAFFLDIDGTLFSDGEIPEINRRAIKKVRESGSLVFINTGRSFASIPKKVFTLEYDGVISSLGSSIRLLANGDYSDYILCDRMDIREVARLCDCLTAKKYFITFEGENTVWGNLYGAKELEKVKNGDELLEKFGNEVISKMYIPAVLDRETTEFLSERYTLCQHSSYAEFTVKGNSKATAIKRVADRFGLDISQTVAVGDSTNDIEMLEFAGISVAMGDGNEKIKEMCDIVTRDASDGGVAEAIEALCGFATV